MTSLKGPRGRLPEPGGALGLHRSHARLSSLSRMFDERIFTGMCGDHLIFLKHQADAPKSA